MARKADPHRAFVAAWREWGERYLTEDRELVGSAGAWFKICQSRRWWDDDRLPPEQPLAPAPIKYKPPKRKRKRSAPTRVTVRVLTAIGRDLAEWAGAHDDSAPARHREREKEFRLRMEQELEEYEEWLGKDEWPLAV